LHIFIKKNNNHRTESFPRIASGLFDLNKF